MQTPWLEKPKTRQVLGTLVRHNSLVWGTLQLLNTVDEVLDILTKNPPVEIKDYGTDKTTVLHTAALGPAFVRRISTQVLENFLSARLLKPETIIYLRYKHGNLRALVKPEDLDPMVLKSLDIYFTVDRQTNELISHHVGKYHSHHELYDYYHLDAKITNLQKLLDSKRFTSVWIAHQEDFDIIDIPY